MKRRSKSRGNVEEKGRFEEEEQEVMEGGYFHDGEVFFFFFFFFVFFSLFALSYLFSGKRKYSTLSLLSQGLLWI